MLNLTFLFETCNKTEIQFIQYVKINVLRIVEDFGTSFEPDQPAYTCFLTRIYTVGCSDSYFDLDFPKFYNGLFES